MFVSALTIENFKRIAATRIPLSSITIVVGGNNSGKTCALQAPHFAVNLLQAAVFEGDSTIPSQNLRYLPTGDILDLPHGERLTEETDPVRVIFEIKEKSESTESRAYSVGFRRGEGLNVRIETTTDEISETRLSDSTRPFSIYVPGLAGIPLREEFRSDALIASAIARGDANLYLRNVLLRISRDPEKNSLLNSYLHRILPGAQLRVRFDEKNDSFIYAWISHDGRETPLDAMGTGILQFLQILAYVIEYRPAMVLLDEPDAHLHPNNQRTIASLIEDIVEDGNTQVVIATHSRTLLDAFKASDKVTFIWIEHGSVQGDASQEHITMLMALGALDGAERFYSDTCNSVFLTEDQELDYIEPFLISNGINPETTLIHSYKTSSQLQAAIDLAKFIRSIKPAVRIIIHRDRDFMDNQAIEKLQSMYIKQSDDIDFFVTDGSDIEHYFTSPEHIAASFEIEATEADKLVNQALADNKVELAVRYSNKIDELKPLYRKWNAEPQKCKDVVKGRAMERDHALGKLLIGKVLELAQETIPQAKQKLTVPRVTLQDVNLQAIAAKIPKIPTGDSKNG